MTILTLMIMMVMTMVMIMMVIDNDDDNDRLVLMIKIIMMISSIRPCALDYTDRNNRTFTLLKQNENTTFPIHDDSMMQSRLRTQFSSSTLKARAALDQSLY